MGIVRAEIRCRTLRDDERRGELRDARENCTTRAVDDGRTALTLGVPDSARLRQRQFTFFRRY